MCDQIVHRGPDGEGAHVDGSVGLGMRRLSILDLAGGTQPMFSQDGSICVVFNGEIYNFQQLRRELEKQGYHFATQCDTEVIAPLYQRYGLDFASKLNGMFAIALWDRDRQRLVLVRDRLGKKPLYYAWTSDGLIFGSELKCLLASGAMPKRLDHEAVYHYFTLGYIPHPWSIYTGVRQLPPACQLTVQGERLDMRSYWQLESRISPSLDRRDTQERLRELLTDAVRLRMVSDVPIGAFLSGGIDSSITVALMAQLSASPVKTFHIDFADPAYSERAYARAVADRYQTEHHELVVKPSAVGLLDQLVASFDEPFGDSSAIPTYCISQLTRQYVTVALAGDGGDESFGGYLRYRRILARRKLPRWLRSGLGSLGVAIHRALPHSAPGRRYLPSLGLDDHRYFAVGTSELQTRELLSSEFLEPIRATSTFELMRGHLETADPSDPLARYTALDIRHYLADDILTKVDRMSMAHSLELRSPLLDYRIVELAAQIPHSWKIDQRDSKMILKETFAKELPSCVLEPRKRGFSLPMSQWLRNELRRDLEDAVDDPDMHASGIFRMDQLRSFAREHISGQRDWRSLLWRYLFFVRWWQLRYAHVGQEPLITCS
jgi:asparagine synthase (glutamine-hydrolysing)